MKELIFYIAMFLIFLGFIGNTKISLFPFSFSIESPWRLAGWFFLILGLAFLDIHSKRNAVKNATKEIREIMEEVKNSDFGTKG